MPEIIEVDDLSFEVRRSSKRKTITLLVDRGGQLVVSAPSHCPSEMLLSIIQSKKQWIYTKLIDKEKRLIKKPRMKEYVSGEGFYYLGKSYRLRIIEPDPSKMRTAPFTFFRDEFCLRSDERYNGRKYFVEWYSNKCYLWLETRLSNYGKRLGVSVPKLKVSDLGYRWGSCSINQINFHWRTIMLPPHIIEYVLVHELAHLIESTHSAEFWHILDRILPDWHDSRTWLADNGVKYNL